MKRLSILLLLCALAPSAAHASLAFTYVSQAGAGAVNGNDCMNARAMTFFNSGANWGAGAAQIGQSTTVHVCGTITSPPIFQGSGAAGANRITLLFESGAKVTAPYGGLINTGGQSHIVIDGGVPCGPGTACSTNDTGTGILEDTANGSGLANQQCSKAIDGTSSGDVEVKNLIIRNQFVHTGTVADIADETCVNTYYANPVTGNVTIHDSTFHDVGWSVLTQAYSGTPTIEVYNVYFWNMNHGVSPFAGNTNVFTYKVHDNHFGAMVNWDTALGDYHHDSIHIFNSGTWGAVSLQFWNNLFDQNAGVYNTAYVFGESNPPNQLWYNNVFVTWPGVVMNDGQVTSGGTNSTWYNNTFLGSTTAGGQCVHVAGMGLIFKNNVLTDCNQLFQVSDAVSAGAAIDYNIYANQSAPGGNARWIWWDGTSTNTLATWQAACACDSHSSYQVAANISPTTYVPLAGSAVIGAAVNLTSLGITKLNSDIYSVSRPGGATAWDGGATQYAAGGTPTSTPSPTSISYGNVATASTTGLSTITLTNSGSVTLNITSIAKTGTDPTKFNLVNGCGGTLAASTACSFTVSFSPTAITSYSASVTVTSDSATSPNVVTLAGAGVAPGAGGTSTGGGVTTGGGVNIVKFNLGDTGRVNTGGGRLNVRALPSPTATIAAVLNNGSIFTIVGDAVVFGETWWKITQGYVVERFIRQ